MNVHIYVLGDNISIFLTIGCGQWSLEAIVSAHKEILGQRTADTLAKEGSILRREEVKGKQAYKETKQTQGSMLSKYTEP